MADRCPECDYDLTGAPSDRCPWCGWAIDIELLEELARRDPRVRRIAIAVGALSVGCCTLIALAALVGRQRQLSLYDALAVLGVGLAAAGHLATGVAAIVGGRRWPTRNRELAALVLFAACVSIPSGIAGATAALTGPGGPPLVRGVVVIRTMDFVLTSILYTLPGWTLLAFRFLAFDVRGPSAGPRAAPPPPSRTTDNGPRTTDNHPRGDRSAPPEVPFAIIAAFDCPPEAVTASIIEAAAPSNPALDALVARVWEEQLARARTAGASLYDGALARLVRAEATPVSLHLVLGRTSYRRFMGTNLTSVKEVLAFGAEHLANPLGVSAAVVTRDGRIALGRRSGRVACHADHLHCFGGMVEAPPPDAPASCDVFAAMRRELIEELGIAAEAIKPMRAFALVQDRTIRQPELLFEAPLTLTRAELLERFNKQDGGEHTGVERAGAKHTGERPGRDGGGEHTGIEFVHDDPDSLVPFIKSAERLSPIALAALLLHGRRMWGGEWFEQSCYLLYGEVPRSNGE